MRTLIVILALALPTASCASGPRFLTPDDAPQTAYGAFLSARYAAQMRDIASQPPPRITTPPTGMSPTCRWWPTARSPRR